MRRIGVILVLLLLLPLAGFGQKEGDIWYEGSGVFIKFVNGQVSVSAPGNISALRGTSSLSSRDGNLVLYSNGHQLRDSSHNIVSGWAEPNAFGGAENIVQGCLLLALNDSLALFFTHQEGGNPFYGVAGKVFRIGLNGPNGLPVVYPGDSLIGDSLSEHLATVRHADGESWWVLSHYTDSDRFIKFLITPSGNISRSEQSVGSRLPVGDVRWMSPLVFNQQGDKFAFGVDTTRLEIFHFDRCTGEIALFNYLEKSFPSLVPLWGLSFSPNGGLLYTSDGYYGPPGPTGTPTNLYQYNLDSVSLLSSETIVYSTPPPCGAWWPGPGCRWSLGGHKLGPDGRIYIKQTPAGIETSVWDTLIVIRNPDIPGIGCNVVTTEFVLPSGSGYPSQFFPNIPNYRLGPLVAQVAEAGPDTTICPGHSITLGVPDTSGTLVINWWTNNGTDQTLSAAQDAQPVATPITATTYYVSIVDTTVHASCAYTIDSVRIELYDTTFSPQAYAGLDSLICQGDSVRLGHTDPSGGSWIYSWTPSSGLDDVTASNPVARPKESTTYYLEVWDIIAGQRIPCREAFDTVFIEVEELLEHPSPEDQDFCPGEILTIGLPPLPGFEYRWMPPTGLQDPFSSLTQVAPKEAISYQLQITDLTKVTDNCRTRSDIVTLSTDGCIMQDVLTPNGDGINDVLFLGLYNQAVQLAIFDRWGVKIYASSGYANDFRGDGLPDGVYYYVLKVSGEGGKEVVGNFVLMR